MTGKTGPVFTIPVNKAAELVQMIDSLDPPDEECTGLARHLIQSTQGLMKGFALVCVAEEDFILWPGGPDIRDYQLGGRKSVMEVIVGDEIYSNQPLPDYRQR